MLVVEIDGLDTQSLQRCVTRFADVLRLAVDAKEGSVRAAHVAELRRQHDGAPPIANRAADQALVGRRSVRVRGVQEGDPEVQRPVDGGDRSAFVGGPVEIRHAHAPEAEGGHSGAGSAELAQWYLHGHSELHVSRRLVDRLAAACAPARQRKRAGGLLTSTAAGRVCPHSGTAMRRGVI